MYGDEGVGAGTPGSSRRAGEVVSRLLWRLPSPHLFEIGGICLVGAGDSEQVIIAAASLFRAGEQ